MSWGQRRCWARASEECGCAVGVGKAAQEKGVGLPRGASWRLGPGLSGPLPEVGVGGGPCRAPSGWVGVSDFVFFWVEAPLPPTLIPHPTLQLQRMV